MVGPGATIVDLDNPTFITTPAGKFDVKRVSDESISFGGESASYPGLTIYGTLNLLSGEMSIFGGKPPDTHIEMSAQLSCKRAKRLEPVRHPPEGLLAPNHMFTR
jgi:hypothetical protein